MQASTVSAGSPGTLGDLGFRVKLEREREPVDGPPWPMVSLQVSMDQRTGGPRGQGNKIWTAMRRMDPGSLTGSEAGPRSTPSVFK